MLRAMVNPGRTEMALAKAESSVERARLEALPNEANLEALDERQPVTSGFEQARAYERRSIVDSARRRRRRLQAGSLEEFRHVLA